MNLGEGDTLIAIARNAEGGDESDGDGGRGHRTRDHRARQHRARRNVSATPRHFGAARDKEPLVTSPNEPGHPRGRGPRQRQRSACRAAGTRGPSPATFRRGSGVRPPGRTGCVPRSRAPSSPAEAPRGAEGPRPTGGASRPPEAQRPPERAASSARSPAPTPASDSSLPAAEHGQLGNRGRAHPRPGTARGRRARKPARKATPASSRICPQPPRPPRPANAPAPCRPSSVRRPRPAGAGGQEIRGPAAGEHADPPDRSVEHAWRSPGALRLGCSSSG